MRLTVSVAIHNPDLSLWRRFCQSLARFLPEDSEVLVWWNDKTGLNGSSQIERVMNDVFDEKLPRHEITACASNIGFGRAHNCNLDFAKGEYFLVLNDDVEFYEPFIEEMIMRLEEDAALGQVGMYYGTCNQITAMGQGAMNEEMRKRDEFDYIEASCMMMRTEDAKKFKLFDTNTFPYAYFEDVDLSLRIRKAGMKLATVDKKWKHHRAITANKVKEEGKLDLDGYKALNWFRFRKKWGAYLVTRNIEATEHIVVRRTGGHGDVFLATPVIDALKKRDPKCAITFATLTPETVQNFDGIDAISLTPYVPIPCDKFIDLEGSYEKQFDEHIVVQYTQVASEVVGAPLEASFTGMPTASRADTIRANTALLTNGLLNDPYVVIGCGDAWDGKRWSKDKWAHIASKLRSSGYKVVLCGISKKLYEIDGTVNFINVLSVTQTLLVIAKAKMFVGHEGLLAHFAQATDVPHVVLYGCTTPECVNFINGDYLFPVVTKAICRGCRHTGMFSGNGIMCPRKFECMEMIGTGDVWKQIKKAHATFKEVPDGK